MIRSNFTKKARIPEILELLFYLFVAFILVYFIGAGLNRLLFLLVLPVVWFSKRDYFWLAFFFILMEMPGGLFSGGELDDPYRLPIYNLAPGVSFTIQELYLLVIFAKSFFRKSLGQNYTPHFFQEELKMLFWLFIILILISPFMGMSYYTMSKVFKITISLTLFYSLLRLINVEDKFANFIKLLFPFTFIALALQIYGLINEQQIIALFKPGISEAQGIYSTDDPRGWVRPIEMGHVMLITFTGSFYSLVSKRSSLNRNYLLLINFISFLVVLLSGTRSWFIAFCTGYIIFFMIYGFRVSRIILNSVLVFFLVLLLVNSLPILKNQVKNAFSRIVTLEEVVKGDVTGGGTISRFDVKAPIVMKAFWSSSIIFGTGFSDNFTSYGDAHIGYHNMLLNAGILGFLVFIYTIWKALKFPFFCAKRYSLSNKKSVRTSIIALVILLVINIGTQTIGFTPEGVNRVILMVYSLLIIEISVRTNIIHQQKQNLIFQNKLNA